MDMTTQAPWLARNVEKIILTLSVSALCSITAGVVLLWGYPVALLVAGGLVWGECLLASVMSLAAARRGGGE